MHPALVFLLFPIHPKGKSLELITVGFFELINLASAEWHIPESPVSSAWAVGEYVLIFP